MLDFEGLSDWESIVGATPTWLSGGGQDGSLELVAGSPTRHLCINRECAVGAYADARSGQVERLRVEKSCKVLTPEERVVLSDQVEGRLGQIPYRRRDSLSWSGHYEAIVESFEAGGEHTLAEEGASDVAPGASQTMREMRRPSCERTGEEGFSFLRRGAGWDFDASVQEPTLHPLRRHRRTPWSLGRALRPRTHGWFHPGAAELARSWRQVCRVRLEWLRLSNRTGEKRMEGGALRSRQPGVSKVHRLPRLR